MNKRVFWVKCYENEIQKAMILTRIYCDLSLTSEVEGHGSKILDMLAKNVYLPSTNDIICCRGHLTVWFPGGEGFRILAGNSNLNHNMMFHGN